MFSISKLAVFNCGLYTCDMRIYSAGKKERKIDRIYHFKNIEDEIQTIHKLLYFEGHNAKSISI